MEKIFRKKKKATGFVDIQGSPYVCAEGSFQLRSCIFAANINAAPIIVVKLGRNELYRYCPI